MNKYNLFIEKKSYYGLFDHIYLREESIPQAKAPLTPLYSNLRLNSKEATVEFEGSASFYISNGNEIIYEFIKNKHSFNDYLHSFVTGLTLFQRGHLLLHGNSCLWQDRHLAFCGESGVGKSSIATQFHKAGASFFCDEIICFNKKNSTTLPGYPFLRLWKNDVDFNQFNPSLISKIWDDDEKYQLNTNQQKSDQKCKLDYLFYLEMDETLSSPEIKEVIGVEKVETFWRSYYHRPVMEAMGLIDQFNQQSLDILKKLRVFKLSRPPHSESRLACFELIKSALV